MAGDVILSVDGVAVDADHDLGEVVRTFQPGDTVSVVLDRDGTEQTIVATLGDEHRRPAAPYEGVGPARRRLRRAAQEWRSMSIASAAGRASPTCSPAAWESTKGIIQVLNPVNIVQHLTGQNDDVATQPTTLVGATQACGSIGDTKRACRVIYLLAALNVFIGVFNMFPLLPLDGGHAAIAIYERIREGRTGPALLRRRRHA